MVWEGFCGKQIEKNRPDGGVIGFKEKSNPGRIGSLVHGGLSNSSSDIE
jgi:hypothetical protein